MVWIHKCCKIKSRQCRQWRIGSEPVLMKADLACVEPRSIFQCIWSHPVPALDWFYQWKRSADATSRISAQSAPYPYSLLHRLSFFFYFCMHLLNQCISRPYWACSLTLFLKNWKAEHFLTGNPFMSLLTIFLNWKHPVKDPQTGTCLVTASVPLFWTQREHNIH